MSRENRPWLSDSHNQIAQLLDILEQVSDDREINVGYPSDSLDEWKKEHSDTFAWIEQINRHANWAHDHYSSLWNADSRMMIEMDKDTTLGAGNPNDTLSDLQSLSIQIGIETDRLTSIMEREKIPFHKHRAHLLTLPTVTARNRLFVDFAQGSRKIDRAAT